MKCEHCKNEVRLESKSVELFANLCGGKSEIGFLNFRCDVCKRITKVPESIQIYSGING